MRGRHDLGTAVNGFGGGRGHDGQDIFAGCGTRVVAARTGRIVEAATAGNEGNYVVMEASDGRQQAYLHLLRPSLPHAGETASARASPSARWDRPETPEGRHLHFELWSPRAGSRAVAP